MNERSITAVSVFGPVTTLTPDERKAIRAKLPGSSARRFTDVSLAIAEAMEQIEMGPDDDIVFASSWGGTMGLETYLASFPNPSPASFQSAVHAGPLESVLVARKQPLRRLQSIGNLPQTLIPASLRALFQSDAATVHLIVAEEYNPWLHEHGLCGEHTFAGHLRLSKDQDHGVLGRLTHQDPEAMDESATPPLLSDAFCQQLRLRQPFRVGSACFGAFTLTWQ